VTNQITTQTCSKFQQHKNNSSTLPGNDANADGLILSRKY